MPLNEDNIEKLVLSAILNNGKDGYIDCADIISEEDFDDYRHQCLFSCVKKSYDSDLSLNYSSILSSSIDIGVDSVVKNMEEFFNELAETKVELADARKFAQKLKKRTIIKSTIGEHRVSISKLQDMSLESTMSSIIAESERPMFNIIKKFSDDETIPENPANNYEEILKNCEEVGSDALGVETPWPLFNSSIGGVISNGAVHLIGARSGVGKTFIGIIQGIHTAEAGFPVLFLDSEMSKNEFFFRGNAHFSKVSPWVMKDGSYVNNDFQKKAVYSGAKRFAALPFYRVDTSSNTFEEIIAIIRRWLYTSVGFNSNGKAKKCLIIYDYFKLMDTGHLKNMQETQAIGFQVMDLVRLCKQYDLPCLAFIQLNRDGIAKETSDVISQSDRLLWNCRSFSIFKPKSEEEVELDGANSGNRKIITVKSSFGGEHEYGNYINYDFNAETCSLKELKTRNASIKDEEEETDLF